MVMPLGPHTTLSPPKPACVVGLQWHRDLPLRLLAPLLDPLSSDDSTRLCWWLPGSKEPRGAVGEGGGGGGGGGGSSAGPAPSSGVSPALPDLSTAPSEAVAGHTEVAVGASAGLSPAFSPSKSPLRAANEYVGVWEFLCIHELQALVLSRCCCCGLCV